MKKFKFQKEKIKTLAVASTFLFSFIFSGKVFASDFNVNLSEEYKKWNELSIEEKENTLMPQTNYSEAPDSILSKYELNAVPSLLNTLLGSENNRLENVSAVVNNSRYNLADKMNMRVEHQGNTTECWAFSTIKAMETNIALLSGNSELENFSERHMDYATSRTFLDGINEKGFSREVGRGGLPISGLGYLSNGQGAVLESDMPFENNEQKVNLSEIDKRVDTIVTDYTILPTISKRYEKDANGNTISVSYYNANGEEYTKDEVESIRNIVKEHLVEKGALVSMTGGNYAKYYSNPSSPFKSVAYHCNDNTIVRDHAITIVGWDDNYSRDNFAEGAKPTSDGAYIVLNTYGTESFDNGYIYISYEDTFIENEMYGIESTSDVDYDKIYQHDYYGGVFQIGTTAMDTGYYGATFERETINENEVLESVGITLADYAKVEIFAGSTLVSDDVVKIGESDGVLSPGYHRIKVDSKELSGSEFAIYVKQTSENGKFYFQVEANAAGTAYADVDSDNRSYISMDGGKTWTNLANFNVGNMDMNRADVCIKAFTKIKENVPGPDIGNNPSEDDDNKDDNKDDNDNKNDNDDNNNKPDEDNKKNELTTEVYKIENEYIMNIPEETKISTFLENVKTDLDKKVMTEDGEEVLNNSFIVTTGMKLKLSDGKEYILIVRGDIKPDGIVELTDISKLILHYNEYKQFQLTGNALKAADMNLDGIIDLTDVSQMIVLYNSK